MSSQSPEVSRYREVNREVVGMCVEAVLNNFFSNPILFAICIHIYIQQIGVRIGCYGLGRRTQ
jgi:hypothetical protein